MRKKELLIQILDRLIPYRNLAEGFLLLVKESEDSEFINEIYQLLLVNMKKISSQQIKGKIQKNIEELKAKESKLQAEEYAEIEHIFDDLLDNLD